MNEITPQKGDKEEDYAFGKDPDYLAYLTAFYNFGFLPFAQFCDPVESIYVLYQFIKDKITFDKTIEYAPISFSLVLHTFVFECVNNSHNLTPKESFANASKALNIDIDTLIKTVIEMPLRYFAMIKFVGHNVYVRNKDIITAMISQFFSGHLDAQYFVVLFVAIQNIAQFADPEKFMPQISRIFSYEDKVDKTILFDFFSCLIIDRSYAKTKYDERALLLDLTDLASKDYEVSTQRTEKT